MKNLLVVIHVIVFCIAYPMQGMQPILKNDNDEVYQEQELQRLAQVQGEYIKFKEVLLELSHDYLFQWYNLKPAEKLIDDANNGRKIKSVEEYGGKRIVLPKLKKPLRYIPSNETFTCNGNCDPFKIIKTYFSDNSPVPDNLPSNAEIDHCIKDRKHSFLSRTILLELATKEEYYEKKRRRAIFAILQGHNILRDVVEKQSSIFIFDVVKDEHFLRDLLDYKIQLSDVPDYKDNPLLARIAVKRSNNVASLRLLKKHGIDFTDPQLIDIALKKANSLSSASGTFRQEYLLSFSFLLDQQMNISLNDIESRMDRVFEEHKNNDDYKAYKALLYVRLAKDFLPFKNIILNKLENDARNQLYQKLIKPLESIKSYQGESIEEFQKSVNVAETTIANILAQFSTNSDLIKHQDFLSKLETKIKNMNDKEKTIRDMFSESIREVPWWLIGVTLSTDCVYQSLMVENVNVNFLRGASAVLVLSGWKSYSYLKKQDKSYHNIIDMLSLQKRMSYLKGYLCGLNSENNHEGIELAHEQQYEKNVNKWHWEYPASLIPLAMSVSCILSALTEDSDISIAEGFGCVFASLYLTLKANKSIDTAWDSLPKLFKCYQERGRLDGYAKRNGSEEQPQFIKQKIEIDQINKPSLESSTLGIFQNVRTIFGGLIKYSKNLFGELLGNVRKIQIRNPNL